jgi:hypothetical protein
MRGGLYFGGITHHSDSLSWVCHASTVKPWQLSHPWRLAEEHCCVRFFVISRLHSNIESTVASIPRFSITAILNRMAEVRGPLAINITSICTCEPIQQRPSLQVDIVVAIVLFFTGSPVGSGQIRCESAAVYQQVIIWRDRMLRNWGFHWFSEPMLNTLLFKRICEIRSQKSEPTNFEDPTLSPSVASGTGST